MPVILQGSDGYFNHSVKKKKSKLTCTVKDCQNKATRMIFVGLEGLRMEKMDEPDFYPYKEKDVSKGEIAEKYGVIGFNQAVKEINQKLKKDGFGLCDKHFEILKDLRQIRLGKWDSLIYLQE